ncbi:hypothetical protein pb186bvf_007826 [Paramecium bursaria]
MGGKQSKPQQPRKRDLLMHMCQGKGQIQIQEPRLKKTLSDGMQQRQKDQLSHLNDFTLEKTKGSNINVTILQYVFTFMTMTELNKLRLVNKTISLCLMESGHIYGAQLSKFYIRNLNPLCFVEYGSDKRFLQAFYEQLQFLDLQQEEVWQTLYRLLIDSFKQLRNFPQIYEKLLTSMTNPCIIPAVLTGDKIKCYTSSWFHLSLLEQSTIQNNTDQYEQDFYTEFNKEDHSQQQLLIELRWVILDNFIKTPLRENKIPILLKQVNEILHFVYLRCLYSYNILVVANQICNQKPQLLNFYVILWRSFQSVIHNIEPILQPLLTALNKCYDNVNSVQTPQMTVNSTLARIWCQIVLKEGNSNSNTLLTSLINLFDNLLFQQRVKQLQIYIDVNQQIDPILSSFHAIDEYFHKSNALDFLLSYFSQAILDISVNEYSINWFGHSEQFELGSIYTMVVKTVTDSTEKLYNQANQQLNGQYEIFQQFIQNDQTYLENIMNPWVVNTCIKRIGLHQLQQKVKTNIRSILLSDEVTEDNDLMQSEILFQASADEVQQRIDGFEDPLEMIIKEIIQEEKLDGIQIIQLPRRTLVQSTIEEGFPVENEKQKLARISYFTSSTRASSIGQLNSQYGLFSSFKQQSLGQEKLVAQLMMKCQNSIWCQRLKELQKTDIQDLLEEEKKNRILQKRNKSLYRISQNLQMFLEYTNVITMVKYTEIQDSQSIIETNKEQNKILRKGWMIV